MNSQQYWREREQLKNRIKSEEQLNSDIRRIHEEMRDEIQKLIDGFYGKYAKAEGISLAEAKKRASKLDIEAYARRAKKYVEEKDFTDRANEEMRLYNLTMKVNRLELLKSQIGLELCSGFSELEQTAEGALSDAAMEEFQRQAGILGETIRMNAKQAKQIANASFHNATFSDRIWMYQDMLKTEIDHLLREGIVQGRNSAQLATHLRKRFGVSQSDAERLMITEMTRVYTAAQEASFKEYGYEEYEFIAEDDARTCSVCSAMDGKHFKVDEMMPGENAPPMHPRCRCSVAAYVDRAQMERELFGNPFSAMSKEMAGNGLLGVPKPGEIITKEELAKFVEEVKKRGYRFCQKVQGEHKVLYGGFENFRGNVQDLYNILDELDASKIYWTNKMKNKGLLLGYEDLGNLDDFARTVGRNIYFNKRLYDDSDYLGKAYAFAVGKGIFVDGTTPISVPWHEIGHVILNTNDRIENRLLRLLQTKGDVRRIGLLLTSNYGITEVEEGFPELLSELLSAVRSTNEDKQNNALDIIQQVLL